MEMYLHKNRNVVVKRANEGDKMFVSFVGVAENVEGSKRRGRHPDYSKTAVKASDLTPFQATAEWLARAERVVAAQDASGMAEAPSVD